MLVTVHLSPKAARDEVGAIAAGPDGAPVLKARVRAAPEAGKANAALCALLAREWRLPKTTLSVSAGASSRRKTVRVAGEPGAVLAALTAWAEARGA